MCSLSKEESILSRETIQNAYLFRIMSLFLLKSFFTFCNISIITEGIDLKLGVCVHYSKNNLLDFLSSIKHPTAEHWRPYAVLLLLIFSSAEHNVLRVSYCDQSLSGVRPSVSLSFHVSVRP